MRNKKFAFQTYKSYRKDKEWHAYDADMWAGRIAYNDALLVVEELVDGLIIVLEKNPYPGEQKRLVAIAVELFPDAGVKFEPGRKRVVIKGKELWWRIFSIAKGEGIGIPDAEKIYFPVAEIEDVVVIERRMWELVREDGTIVAAEVPKALNMKATGKQYAVVKETLKGRGWKWVQKRITGRKRETVVIPPNVRRL